MVLCGLWSKVGKAWHNLMSHMASPPSPLQPHLTSTSFAAGSNSLAANQHGLRKSCLVNIKPSFLTVHVLSSTIMSLLSLSFNLKLKIDVAPLHVYHTVPTQTSKHPGPSTRHLEMIAEPSDEAWYPPVSSELPYISAEATSATAY